MPVDPQTATAGSRESAAPDLDGLGFLGQDPNPLAAAYSRFRVAERILLTGHSHQAWPDVSREGQIEAWDDAARRVDEKWDAAFERAEEVKRGFARRLGDLEADGALRGSYVLAANTHELLVRFLSALPLRERPRLVITDGEFHSLRRQAERLEEEGIEIVRVPAGEPESVAERLADAVDDHTAAVLASSVLFQSGRIVPGLGLALAAARRHGAEMVVDAYHQVNVVPMDLGAEGLDDAHVVGGGYKYCQLGEGNCFLRVPPGRRPRPVITGWFAEFEALEEGGRGVAYGKGADAYVGATYDPTSHYRAARVWRFFDERRLDPEVLRRISRQQVGRLVERFDALDLDPDLVRRPAGDLAGQGGFLVLRTPRAEALRRGLAERGVATDHRGDALRLGPAPYLSDRQLDDAVAALGETAAELAGKDRAR